MISITELSKVYSNGFRALNKVSLRVDRGEIFALLGPNGAGKTTLIGIACGIVNATKGEISIDGYDIRRDFREARSRVGLVPQELTTDAFESVWNTVRFSRGLFGKPKDPAYLEKILRQLSLWDKRNDRIMTLSGGMKRRVMIAKALSHEPNVLFLDEPTAGVDVELRKGMWDQVRELKRTGVTIVLTTHYIAEAEEMADRIGVIHRGELILSEKKSELIQKLGNKQLAIGLARPIAAVPSELAPYGLTLDENGTGLLYNYDRSGSGRSVQDLLRQLHGLGLAISDVETKQRSLEDIFVGLVKTP